MRLEVTIIFCFWEEETRNVSTLDDGEETMPEIVQVFYCVVTKCLIGDATLVGSS